MIEFITHLDKPAAWLVAVVAGLGALGWLAKKTRNAYKRLKPWVRRAATVIDLAEYELQHNGGGSLKDMAAQIPTLTANMSRLNEQWHVHLQQADARDAAIAVAKQAQETLQAGQETLQEAVDEVQVTVTYLVEHLPPQDDN